MAEVSQSLKSFLIFSILSALYILSMFYRVSNAIIAPNLIQDLGLDAETLGIPRGSFFYSFALLQIPMGPMLDRIGPRIIITAQPSSCRPWERSLSSFPVSITLIQPKLITSLFSSSFWGW